MKRALISLLVLAACAAAGALAAAAGTAGTAAPGQSSTASATTIPEGVTIAGVPVGGLAPEQAAAAVGSWFARALLIQYGSASFEVSPDELGATAAVAAAVERARAAAPGTALPLGVTVDRDAVRAFVARLARRFDRKPVDARLALRRLRPWIARERPGLVLQQRAAVAALVSALESHDRGPVELRGKRSRPRLTRKSFGPVIVIRRSSNRLYLYSGMRFRRMFGVATGQRTYPTPLGRFRIVVKWRNPWWYPPKSPWAAGQKPIPPGPGNPLGTRWMGLSSPGVGIHGTPQPGSIGYSVSHGCIRMRIPDAEWLFEQVRVGTTVFIVAA